MVYRTTSVAAEDRCMQPSHEVGDHFDRPLSNSSSSVAEEKSSLYLTQRFVRKLAKYNASQNVFKRWLFEIVSFTISALCMGAIVGIYLQLNGIAMTHGETLLTVVNILRKVASAALIVPTSEALGQLKWN